MTFLSRNNTTFFLVFIYIHSLGFHTKQKPNQNNKTLNYITIFIFKKSYCVKLFLLNILLRKNPRLITRRSSLYHRTCRSSLSLYHRTCCSLYHRTCRSSLYHRTCRSSLHHRDGDRATRNQLWVSNDGVSSMWINLIKQ
jgi:hypothetical protein